MSQSQSKSGSLQKFMRLTSNEEQKRVNNEHVSSLQSFEDSSKQTQPRTQIHATLDLLKYKTHCPFSQLQRAIFLRFLFSYGLNFDKIQDVHDRLMKFYPGHFKEGDYKGTEDYLKPLIALVYHYSNPNIDQSYTSFYLFNFQRVEVYKRICQLKKLKMLQEEHRQDPSKFPFLKVFQIFLTNISAAVRFPNWNATEDYLLVSLILDKGYGRWSEILQHKDWSKYLKKKPNIVMQDEKQSRQQQTVANNKKYREHLQYIIYDERKTVPLPLPQVLQQRASFFLKLVK